MKLGWRQVVQQPLRSLVAYSMASVLIALPPPVAALSSETTFGADIPASLGDVRLVGEASPNALVTFLRDGVVIGTQSASSTSVFDKTFTAQDPGVYTYAVYATDQAGRQTGTVNFSVTVIPGETVTLGGILLPPTLVVAANPIKRPQTQSTAGMALQGATVTTFYSGSRYGDNFARSTATTAAGNWSATAGRTLHLGAYNVSALVQTGGGAQSQLSPATSFQVLLSADLNLDNRVNLTDFSILMFYYSTNTDRAADINDDGRVNLTDFSIMLFYWTG